MSSPIHSIRQVRILINGGKVKEVPPAGIVKADIMLQALLIILAFAGCSTIERKLYAPTLINNPSLQAKNDYSVTAAISSPLGFDVNGGYALTNRLAFIAGVYSYRNNDKQDENSLFSSSSSRSDLLYKHSGFHVGSGVYFPISPNPSNTTATVLAGYTNGSFEMREANYETSPVASVSPKLNFYKSNITRWFLQAGITQHQQRSEWSVISRFNYVGYGNVNTDYSFQEQESYQFPPISYPKWSEFLDISFDFKAFLSDKKTFGLQFIYTTSTRWHREEFNFYYYPTRIGIGIFFRSPTRPKTKDK